jgi:hypothetical protein
MPSHHPTQGSHLRILLTKRGIPLTKRGIPLTNPTYQAWDPTYESRLPSVGSRSRQSTTTGLQRPTRTRHRPRERPRGTHCGRAARAKLGPAPDRTARAHARRGRECMDARAQSHVDAALVRNGGAPLQRRRRPLSRRRSHAREPKRRQAHRLSAHAFPLGPVPAWARPHLGPVPLRRHCFLCEGHSRLRVPTQAPPRWPVRARGRGRACA